MMPISLDIFPCVWGEDTSPCALVPSLLDDDKGARMHQFFAAIESYIDDDSASNLEDATDFLSGDTP